MRNFQHLKIGCLFISQKIGIFDRLSDKLKAVLCLLEYFGPILLLTVLGLLETVLRVLKLLVLVKMNKNS